MRGVGTMYYRRAFARHFSGVDAMMAPFIPTVNSERINPKLLKDVLPENNAELPLIPQVIGNNADDFVHMNAALHDLGYEEVNWNLGCPHKPIRKKRRGSGLIPHPDTVDAILNQVCENSPIKVSVKVRLGVAEHSELLRLIPVLNRYPLTEVIVHPRTAEQMYDGTVNLDAFGEAYDALEHPVCYNGDIHDRTSFQKVSSRFPDLQRFMLGRGLLAHPFLCELIKTDAVAIENPIARIRAFHDDLLTTFVEALHGDQPVLSKMKEFWTYQATHLSNGKKLFKKVKKSQYVATYSDIVAEYLADAKWTA